MYRTIIIALGLILTGCYRTQHIETDWMQGRQLTRQQMERLAATVRLTDTIEALIISPTGDTTQAKIRRRTTTKTNVATVTTDTVKDTVRAAEIHEKRNEKATATDSMREEIVNFMLFSCIFAIIALLLRRSTMARD